MPGRWWGGEPSRLPRLRVAGEHAGDGALSPLQWAAHERAASPVAGEAGARAGLGGEAGAVGGAADGDAGWSSGRSPGP